jgi:hypothetical protein
MFLAGLAVFSRREVLGSSFNPSWELSAGHRKGPTGLREHFLLIIRTLRPDWLGDWLQKTHERMRGRALSYALLRTLEDEQLIAYAPNLAGWAVVQLLQTWGNELSDMVPVPPNGAALIADKFRADPVLLQRDLPLLFDFDNFVDTGHGARIQPAMPLNAKGIRQADGEYLPPWQVWNQQHPMQYVTWQEVLLQLVESGHLDRADILTRCLLALRRDFRRSLLAWFKELFLALKPTLTERLARQSELTELLPHALPTVANFAMEQLRELMPEPGFSLAPLLLYADNLLTRPDLKTGLRTLLTSLLKLPKQDAAHAPVVARLLAAALPHPDGQVQERAAKGLASLLAAPRPLLSPEETATALAAIQANADLLAAPARTALAAWLPAVASVDSEVETAFYAPATQFTPELSPATAIVPVADWHELLFLTGQVLRHDDPAATERWLDGLLRLHGQLPAGFAGQLRPYLAQLFPEIKKASDAEVAAILTRPVRVYGYQGLVQTLLLSWATDFTVPRVDSVDILQPHKFPNPLLPISKCRYLLAEKLLMERRNLPLLSTPTHQPAWVAPSGLVSRLLAYQAAGVAPELSDLAVALARTAHAHPAEAAEALRQLPAIADSGLRELLTWFLGPAGQPLPALANATEQRPPAGLQSTITDALPELWAIAARTKAPAGSFPTLPAVLGYDYPGLAQPLLTTFEEVQRENQYSDPDQPSQTKTFRFIELAWASGALAAAPSPLLLYAPPFGKSEYGSWEGNWVMAQDLVFLLALVPGYGAPLYEQILRSAAWADNLETNERDMVAQTLRALLNPGPAFESAETALVACGLVHHTPLCRSLAHEVLLRAVAEGRLQPAPLGRVLGQQLAIGYTPVPRLSDGLAVLIGIDAVTDDALRQVLDALLPELPASPLRNMRKLLEAYSNLRVRTSRPVPAAVSARLHEWRAAASLKQVAGSLLA